MFDKHRNNTAIRESLNFESLLLQIVFSQIRWFGHVSNMPQERLPLQTLYAEVNGKKSHCTTTIYYVEDLDWKHLGLRHSEMQYVLVDREVQRLNLKLLPATLKKKRVKKKRRQKYCTSLRWLPIAVLAYSEVSITKHHILQHRCIGIDQYVILAEVYTGKKLQ